MGNTSGGRGQAAGEARRRLTVGRVLPLDVVVEVINEWGTVPRRAAGEQDHCYPDFAVLAAANGLGADPDITVSDHQLTCIADALYPIFAAATEDDVVAAVNQVLARSTPQPRLGRDGGPLAGQWAAPAPQQLFAACVLPLYEQLIRWGDSRRIGLCKATRCADVYVDLSRTGRKRFCSHSCQNRDGVAAFRARYAAAKLSQGNKAPPNGGRLCG